jgi:hypothetical protein
MKVFEVTQQIDVRGIQQRAKIKAYNDAIAAGKSEAEAQNAEAAAGNLAGADALRRVNINNPATYINDPGDQAGPRSEAERQEWMRDPTQTSQAAQAYPVAAPKPATGTPVAPKPAASWNPGVLGLGSSGPEVKALQKKLGIPDDGQFGPATKKAVEELQKKLSVTVDGAYGPVTKKAHEASPQAQAPATPAPQAQAPATPAPQAQAPATPAPQAQIPAPADTGYGDQTYSANNTGTADAPQQVASNPNTPQYVESLDRMLKIAGLR